MPLLSKLKSELFKALAHPIRIEILELLTEGELCVCHIYEDLEQSQSNVSQHLSKLKNAQLVEARKDGLQVYYSLKDEKVIEIIGLSKEILLSQIDEARESLTKE
ncbi:ArsR/SmtB family transcription factor [Orenia marismortui]|uniref:ArsR/SmtB family transcription factor n=1 Tax=Orenia marismortui TaxID=46469 RepID=UPI00037F6A6B|nr:metalloregulator ArsR/SmtB family transcription factor [Orenia marismortui]